LDSLNVLVRRHYRAIGFILVIAILVATAWGLRSVTLPFVIGFILAWLLQPAIDGAQRHLPGARTHPRIQRVCIILALYLTVAVLTGVLVFYVATTLGKPMVTLMVEVPRLIPAGVAAVEERLDSFLVSLPAATRAQVSEFISQAGTQAGEVLVDFITGGIVRIRGSSNMILGFVALPVFLFYLLKDWHGLRNDLYGVIPPWALEHVRSILAIVRNVIGRYLRAQLLLGLAVGTTVSVMLVVADIDYAVPLGVFAGVAELVPIAGPWLAAIVGILVVLATAPQKVLWIALGYLTIQLLQNNLLTPRVQGQQMMIHPALVILLTIVAASLLGLAGFLIVLPVTMTVVQIVKYIRCCAHGGAGEDAGLP